jgi:hypothetical protein
MMSHSNANVPEAIFENPEPIEGISELVDKALLSDEVRSSIDLEKSACEDELPQFWSHILISCIGICL